MALLVEDGSEVAGAESYATVTYADSYHYGRGNSAWGALDTTVKEQCLRRATDYMTQKYRSSWKGTRVTDTQSLDWPRSYVYIDNANAIDSDVVPVEVQRACCEFALKSNDGELIEDGGRVTVLEKVDVLEVEYSDNGAGSNKVSYSSIDMMLNPYLLAGASGNGGIVGRVDRA